MDRSLQPVAVDFESTTALYLPLHHICPRPVRMLEMELDITAVKRRLEKNLYGKDIASRKFDEREIIRLTEQRNTIPSDDEQFKSLKSMLETIKKLEGAAKQPLRKEEGKAAHKPNLPLLSQRRKEIETILMSFKETEK